METTPHRRLAVVTGAASGVGLATAVALGEVGTAVVGVDLSPRPAALADRRVEWIAGDVADDATWQRVGARLDALDPRGPDCLVCCAGDVIGGSIATTSLDEWRRGLEVNLLGVVRAMQAVIPAMTRQRDGAIAVVCSMNSLVAEFGAGAYSTAKAALLHAVRSAAVEHAAPGLRINAVCPGCVDTPLLRKHLDATCEPERYRRALERRTPTGRLVSAEEVAATLRFLVSRDASGIVGASITVDGGMTVTYDFDHDAVVADEPA
jgi:NAD(P)-dependent dehydrogenase (short-subunit alcohol dehydrogenase family)